MPDLTKELNWELIQLQSSLLEQAKTITRVIEEGVIRQMTHEEVKASLAMFVDRWDRIPFKPRPPRP